MNASPTPPPRPPEPFETPNLDIVVNGFLSAIDTSHSGDACRAQNERMAKGLDAAAREELRQLRQRASEMTSHVEFFLRVIDAGNAGSLGPDDVAEARAALRRNA